MEHLSHKPDMSIKDRYYINLGCHDVILLYASGFGESWKPNCDILSIDVPVLKTVRKKT